LARADLKKDAGAFALPIALGRLSRSSWVAIERTGSFAIVGGLAQIGEYQLISVSAAHFAGLAARRRRGSARPPHCKLVGRGDWLRLG
jgi:hypothetical protein